MCVHPALQHHILQVKSVITPPHTSNDPHSSQYQVTCPQSTRSPSPQSVGALSGSHGSGRGSGSGGGSGGSHPDS